MLPSVCLIGGGYAGVLGASGSSPPNELICGVAGRAVRFALGPLTAAFSQPLRGAPLL